MTNGRLMSSMRGMPLLILTTTGSKSGKERTIPVMYIRDGKNYVITASNNGWKKNPGWFYNLKASQQAQIEVPGERMQVSASVPSPDEHARFWPRMVAKALFFQKYQDNTDRIIPMVILTPN